jgi:gamma-carbonic anhydrase
MNEAVIRGDVRLVRIGAYTTIGEGTVVTEASGPLSDVHDGSCVVGHYVSVGPNCTLHATTIEPECVVGAGSVLAEGSYMATQSRLEPGSYLAPNARVPTGELWGGKPSAAKIRNLSEEERAEHKTLAEHSYAVALTHKDEVEATPYPMEAVWEAEKLGFGNVIGYQLKQ